MTLARLPSFAIYAIPLLFWLAVVLKTLSLVISNRRKNTEKSIPTEPLVLMTLGVAFLLYTAPLANVSLKMAEMQIHLIKPDLDTPFIDWLFAFSVLALFISFSKAFWTHLNLEEGEWGSYTNYRAKIWPHAFSSTVEFILRLVIAIDVVLLQKAIASMQYIPNVDHAKDWSFANERSAEEFLQEYQHWVAKVALLSDIFFFLIIIWLLIAFFYNLREGRGQWSFWLAAFSTFTFGLPGLVLSLTWCYFTTGSPVPLGRFSQPDLEWMLISATLTAVAGLVIIFNMIWTIFQARRALYEFFNHLQPSQRKETVA